MDKAQILALADRVEALTGPDREVDAQIFRTTESAPPFQYLNKLIALSWHEQEQAYFAQVSDDMRVRYDPPHFTASLDAAMTLVPEGFVFSLDTFGSPAVAKVYLVRHDNCYVRTKRHTCATPALALTAASLRAMVGGEDGNV